MKKKAIATTLIFWFSACIMMLFICACTPFFDVNKSDQDLTSQGIAKFVGSIRPYQGNADSHYGLGCYLQEKRKYQPAIEEFKAALELDPKNVKSYNGLGVSYDALGDYDRAVESYTAALKIDEKLDYVLNNLGYSYLLQGRFDLAIENFKKALDLDSGNALYRNNLGLAYAKNGLYNAAFAEFKKTGSEAESHYNIAQLYYRQGLYKEAQDHFEQASVLKASDPEIERGLKASGTLAQITAKSEERPEKVAKATVPAEEEQRAPYDEGRAYSIPNEALEIIKVPEVAEVGLIEKHDSAPIQNDAHPALPPAVSAIKIHEGAREEAAKILEAKPLKLYDETQALKLVSVQNADIEKEPTRRIKMEVSNGNGVRRMAKDVGDYLSGNGFVLYYLSNAGSFSHEVTKIYYAKGYLREAYVLAQKLPGKQSLEEVGEIKNGNAQLSILIGKDLIPRLSFFKKG
jgi:tetratricopeptide (TPR) repeat protein